MYLRRLHLRQFRNYGDRAIAFDAPKTILVGDNAQGKSNVLEAVELLATLQSHRTSRDGDLIQEGAAIATVQGQIERQSSGSMDLELILRRGGRRTVALNGQGLRRQADGLGTLNAVLFSSLDLELVRGGPERRRAWLDGLLLQLEPLYSHILGQYNRVLRQRNALLRQQLRGDRGAPGSAIAAALPVLDRDDHTAELALWDAQLAIAAARVVRRRARALALLAPKAAAWHRDIGGGTETLDITYVPNGAIAPDLLEGNEGDRAIAVQQAFLRAIHEKATAERHQGTSLVGPHRDDIDLRVNGTPARQFGSQGQQRTLVLALKLAELTTLEGLLGEPPLLLLDDVLAELDLKRQDRLLSAIADRFQTLVTATHLGAFDGRWLDGARILTVRRGQIDATG
ncbi:MAG: DNA replication/repair protein RecF [Cyanophyceae cyanobacterium]